MPVTPQSVTSPSMIAAAELADLLSEVMTRPLSRIAGSGAANTCTIDGSCQ
jgi:hypothetical protein